MSLLFRTAFLQRFLGAFGMVLSKALGCSVWRSVIVRVHGLQGDAGSMGKNRSQLLIPAVAGYTVLLQLTDQSRHSIGAYFRNEVNLFQG